MWPEAYRSAVYILNRTPMKQLGWKTPHEVAYSESKAKKLICKPYIGNLYKFGSRAYARVNNIPRTDKVKPRAQIGYLVGYEAHNIWKIWLPHKPSTVIRVRDCRFDETKPYDRDDPFSGFKISESMPERIITSELPKIGNLEDFNVEEDVFDGLDENGNLVQGWKPTQVAETQETDSMLNSQQNNEETGLAPTGIEENPENRDFTPISIEREAMENQSNLIRDGSDRLPNQVIEQAILPKSNLKLSNPCTPPETPQQTADRDFASTPQNVDLSSLTAEPELPASAPASRDQSRESQTATTSVVPPAVAPRDVNLQLSETNIITGSRNRQPSRRA